MEKYQNASKGLKYLFLSEALMICEIVVGLAAALGALLSGDSGTQGWVSSVIGIIAQIMGFMGVFTLSKDAPEVRSAFYLKVAALVVSVLGGVIALASTSLAESLGFWVYLATSIIDLIVLYRVLMSGGRLCAACGREDIQNSGKAVWRLKVISIIASVVITVLTVSGTFAGLNGAESAGGVMGIVATVLAAALVVVEIVASVKYIIFLHKGYKALA